MPVDGEIEIGDKRTTKTTKRKPMIRRKTIKKKMIKRKMMKRKRKKMALTVM